MALMMNRIGCRLGLIVLTSKFDARRRERFAKKATLLALRLDPGEDLIHDMAVVWEVHVTAS